MRHGSTSAALEYIRALYAPEDALLQDVAAQLERAGRAIQVGPEEGRLLQVLIKLAQVKTIVEIGTLAGYSTLWMARALPEDGRIYTLDRDPDSLKMARANFAASGLSERITQLEGAAIEQLPSLNASGPFDMVFIDADKINYVHYLEWAEQHVRQGGLIVGDNTLLFDEVYQDAPKDIAPTTWQAMRVFNERLSDKDRYDAVMLPTQEGLTIAVKRF